MEIAAAATGETVKCSIGHLEREINYLIYFGRNVDNLKYKFDQLNAEKSDVEQRILEATNNNRVIKETVNKWLNDVDVVQTDVTQLSDEVGQISSCFKGWFCSRFRLSRKAYKKIPGIQDLLDRRITFGERVSDPKPIQSLERVSAFDYRDFTSRKLLTKNIINALVNDDLCLVGIFGMPGIGKTKLMEALSKRVKKEKLFDEVVMITISENPDVKTIQNNVGKQLDMQLEDSESISDRAMRLHDRLKTHYKRTLIVLDDLWDELKLEDVGIPRKSECKSYIKIAITTRAARVCAQMETDMEFEVQVLSKQDSWTLFLEKVGGVINSPELETIARKIVDECAGLPLAIVTLGKALRTRTSVSVWADRLRRLQKSIYEDSMTVVDSSIKLSYDFLSNEVQKRCFLYCSLFPEDYNINIEEELFVYVVGEKLLEDGEDCFNSLEEAKGRLDSIVEDLISSSLLLRSSHRDGCIMMHDVVRDVAKMIAFRDEEFKQEAGAIQTDLIRWPEQLESCKRLSLMRTKIKCNLPLQVEAPQLLTLILAECEFFSELPCVFFQKMKNLRNLDLSRTKIASLPQSMSCLVELVTLRLRECYSLKNISPVEKLEKLEILDLCESGIETLSEEMGMLTNLKSLNMSYMRELTSISPKVISSMCQLEELYAIKDKWSSSCYSICFSEVASLAKLSCLEIIVPNVECLSINATSSIINWVNNLKQFLIDVGCSNYLFPTESRSLKRRLHVEIPSSISVPREFIWLLRRADFVLLYKCNDLESVVQVDPTGGGFKDNNLKRLEVDGCSSMKYLMSSIEVEKSPEISFSSLEELVFHNLDNLESICNGKTLPEGFLHNLRELEFWSCLRLTSVINWESQNLGNTSSASSSCRLSLFSNLRELTLISCYKIRYVLPMSVARGLNQLVRLHVDDCPSIEMIIANDNGEDDDGDNYILPRLEELTLDDLPALVSFGRPGLVFDWDSLKHLKLRRNFWNLKSLPCRVTQHRLSKFNYFTLDATLIHLLEDPAIIIDDLEHVVDEYGESYYSKKVEEAEE